MTHSLSISMLIGDDELKLIRQYQANVRPEPSVIKAAVAIILRDGIEGTELLLMQRAKHDKDPWSGQMSFPGGKIEPSDLDSKATAMREAFEEVGADLNEGDYVGRLDDVYGLKANDVFSVHIACYIFKPKGELKLKANHEVADMVWLPLSALNDRRLAFAYQHPRDPALNMPAVMLNAEKEQILWGLSLRMLANFHDLLGWPMSVLNESERRYLADMEKRNLSPEHAKQINQRLKQ